MQINDTIYIIFFEATMDLPKLQDHIHTLCEELDIHPKPTVNEKLQYKLILGSDIELLIQEFDNHAFVSSKIQKCPLEKKEELFIQLMEANLLGQGTGNSAIGLDPEEKFLTLSLILPYELNYTLFKETVEDFVNYLFFWREKIDTFEQQNKESIL